MGSHEALIRRVAKPGGTVPPSALPSTTFRVRKTEGLIRDDGAGNPVWKIWHHHCSVHAPDDQIRTGFQDSGLTRAANMADDLEALRKMLGLGRIVLFGMSFGGMLALTYAATYPDSVAGLIPCATAASDDALERALSGMHDLSPPEQRKALARLRNGTVQSAEDLDRVFGALAQFYEYGPQRTPPGGFKPIADIDMLNWFFARERQTYDIRPRLGAITAPTLVLPDAATTSRRLSPRMRS